MIIACLSCHDGNLAKVGMMHGQTVETLPIVGGHAPTLLGNDSSTVGNYNNDHPVGNQAAIGCGGHVQLGLHHFGNRSNPNDRTRQHHFRHHQLWLYGFPST